MIVPLKFKTILLNPGSVQKALIELYPDTSNKINLDSSFKLFSPYQILLPQKYLKKIQNFNKILHKIYNHNLTKLKSGSLKLKNPLFAHVEFKNLNINPSILSCLDFHIDFATDQISLIEANTNASGFLIGSLVYKIHDLDFSPMADKLMQMFNEALITPQGQLFIMDEQPEQQKMYLEFLMYQEFLQQHGKDSTIIDGKSLDDQIKQIHEGFKNVGIYNRSTDFYLAKHPKILDLFLNQKILISPHPIVYDLWAHKDNLHEWTKLIEDETFITSQNISKDESRLFSNSLLLSQPMQKLFKDIEQAWEQRKKFFFKPSDSYGGKATYRGASISRKYFDIAWRDNFLAQAYSPASILKDDQSTVWKFDIRVYVYQDEIIYCLARIYQGQTTNFNTLGGGFAPITFY